MAGEEEKIERGQAEGLQDRVGNNIYWIYPYYALLFIMLCTFASVEKSKVEHLLLPLPGL